LTDKNSFLNQYPLDYLFSNKDKKSDAYQELYNTCVYLLDGHKSSEPELEVSWDVFRAFVLVFALYLLRGKTFQRIAELFNEKFNHSDESLNEFMLWNVSDLLNETDEFLSSNEIDWEATGERIDLSALENAKEKASRDKPRKRSKAVEKFYRDFVSQGRGHVQRPSEQDMQAFAKETLQLIASAKVKDALKKITYSPFIDWFPEEDKRTLERIGKLTFMDGKEFINAKPLLELWQNDYASTLTTIDQDEAQIAAGSSMDKLEDTTGWDKTLIEMWGKGYSRDEIALRVKVSKDRVTNRVTELRNKFGKKIVPYNKDRKKVLIKS
jgi:hypothetical protein